MSDFAVVVPYVNRAQLDLFLDAWGVPDPAPPWLVLEPDESRSGCAATKNRGIARAADAGADVVVVLDDDCFPGECATLEHHAAAHAAALEDQPVAMFAVVTDPPSRGTPYRERTLTMPVAASMGFWTEIGDYCAVRQLVDDRPMAFRRGPVYGRYFPLSGMNLAFRPREWMPWCTFVDVPRFDDIWMGWLWQRAAYDRGACFNLDGPSVRHVRQSDVWRNLEVEARHLRASETLWRDIAISPDGSYEALAALLPADPGGSDR